MRMVKSDKISPCPICNAPREIYEEFGGVTVSFSCDHGEQVLNPMQYHLKKLMIDNSKNKKWKASKEDWEFYTK